ncbi:spindle and kinetochore-associated protein 3 [Rhinophrynus dorsalis]
MSVTGNFFSKLRSLAITLEKETEQLEQVFSKDENEYEEESPMRVLHDLRSEIMLLKGELQTTYDKRLAKGHELTAFIKVCKVLQQRTAADIQQIKDSFQNYGYKPLCTDNSDPELTNEPENNDPCPQKSEPEDVPAQPTLEKQSTSWDLLRPPQLSDFGLSHYQLPAAWEVQSNKPCIKKPPVEKSKPLFDIRPLNVAKTPKCALRLEDDFPQIQHFGISDCGANLNDDYTMALINKRAQKGSVLENNDKEACPSRSLKSILATPSHLYNRTEFGSVDSPAQPVFCTPGLKVHKMVSLPVGAPVNQEPVLTKRTASSASDSLEINSSDSTDLDNVGENAANEHSKNLKSILATPAHLSLGTNFENVFSPRPPVFCTPGLKVHKKENGLVSAETLDLKESTLITHKETPPVPSFQTNWLNSDALTKTLEIKEPGPRPELSYGQYLEEPAALVLNSHQYEKPTKISSPPKVRDYSTETPPRPEMTMNLTEDVFKYNMKHSSPPKMSEYEKMLWTPARPEMTSCITEDISQILSLYCDNKTKSTDMAWNNKMGISAGLGKVNSEHGNKENRLY